jgi:hypothetical protein
MLVVWTRWSVYANALELTEHIATRYRWVGCNVIHTTMNVDGPRPMIKRPIGRGYKRVGCHFVERHVLSRLRRYMHAAGIVISTEKMQHI